MAEDNTAKLRPVATELPGHLIKVQCISGVQPWAEVHINDGGVWKRKNPTSAEPLQLDQVAVIPKDQAYQRMLRNRHIVRFAEE